MATLTGYSKIFADDTTAVDTAKKHQLGSRALDVDGNEYIYLTGVASTAAGSWVTFDELHITTLAVADAVGRVAIAMAATVASRYGWYQIYGKSTTAIAASPISDGEQLYLSATLSGKVEATNVAGDLIKGVLARGAAGADTSPFTIEMSYPFVDDTADN